MKIIGEVNSYPPGFQQMIGRQAVCSVRNVKLAVEPADIATYAMRMRAGVGRDDTSYPSVKCVCGGYVYLEKGILLHVDSSGLI